MYPECKKSIKNAINLIEMIMQKEDNFTESTINYIKGVSCSLKSDYYKFNNKKVESEIELKNAEKYFDTSMKLLKIKKVDHLILFTFLSREIGYCKYQQEMSNNYYYFINANTLIKELDWILTLYERTLGLFYNYVGVHQMNKLLFKRKIDEDFVSIDNFKNLCEDYDNRLNHFINHLTPSEWENLKIELNQMKNPIYNFEKSLNYLSDVNDEIVVAATHMDISQIYVFKENIYRAKLELEVISKNFMNFENDLLKAQFHHSCAYIKSKQRNIEGAVSEYSKALEFAEKANSERAQIVIYNNIIPLLIELKEIDKSLLYCKNAMKLIESNKEISQEKLFLAKFYLHFCVLNVIKFQNYDVSNDYLDKAMKLSEVLNDSGLANSIESIIIGFIIENRDSNMTSDNEKEILNAQDIRKYFYEDCYHKDYVESLRECINEKKNNITAYFFPEADDNFIKSENFFYVARRFNSYTPALPLEKKKYLGKGKVKKYTGRKGGGYLLSWKGKLIAIDPGYNFIENIYYNENIRIKDIDCIIITHAHPDHVSDFENLLMLLYEYNDELCKTNDNVQFHYIDVFMNLTASQRFLNIIQSNKYIKTIKILNPWDSYLLENYNMKLELIKNKHKDLNSDDFTIGLLINLYEDDKIIFKLGLTSDTGSCPRFTEQAL